MKAIKYILAVAILAVCAYFLFPTHKAYFHEWEIVSEDDEFAYGIPLDEDFDMFVLQKFADAGGVLTMDEVCHDYEQTKMEIFYGRY